MEDNETQNPMNNFDGKAMISDKFRENPWILSTLVLGIVSLILIVGNFSGVFGGMTGNVISSDDAGEKLLSFYESTGAQGLKVASVEEASGVYQVNFEYQGAVVPIFVTKDGELAGSLSPIKTISDSNSDSSNSQPNSPSAPINVAIDDDAVKGDSNAPVTMIEFSDYECPFCGRYFQQTYPQIVKEYVDTGKVKIVFRDFPLSFHENAQKAAEAAECAGEQGKYWEMHDKLFKNQNALEINSLRQYAKELGLNTKTFDDCLDSGKMASEIQKDFEDGQDAGVSGTPAFFINGISITGAQPFEEFKKIIEQEINK